jgi:hypothetical protein
MGTGQEVVLDRSPAGQHMTGSKTNEEAHGPASQDKAGPQQWPQAGASGAGAASAFARMKSERDLQARQRPADESHPDGLRGTGR